MLLEIFRANIIEKLILNNVINKVNKKIFKAYIFFN